MAINFVNGMYPPPVRSSGGQVDRVAPARPDQVGALPDQPVAEADKVDLTPHSLNLRQMEIQNPEPPIDRERVAALREAIASGRYSMDSGRIARKLLDFESRLVTVHTPLPQAGEGSGVRVVDSSTDPPTLTLSPMNGGEGTERLRRLFA